MSAYLLERPLVAIYRLLQEAQAVLSGLKYNIKPSYLVLMNVTDINKKKNTELDMIVNEMYSNSTAKLN